MSLEEKYTYQFGPFFLDPYERILKHENTQLTLRRKAFDTLLYLVQNPGRLIRSEELLEAVWANTMVELASISVVIHELRRVLGQEVQIQTVRGIGYRIIISVNRIAMSQAKNEVAVDTAESSSRTSKTKRRLGRGLERLYNIPAARTT